MDLWSVAVSDKGRLTLQDESPDGVTSVAASAPARVATERVD